MALVLVVDDDPHIRHVVQFALQKAGFQVIFAQDGREAIDACRAQQPDLMVLDILMPELDGLAVCREVRAESAVPIIFLTSVDEELDRVIGLELGADDYVTKPFSPRELTARVKSVLRRTQVAAPPEAKVLNHGAIRMDLDGYCVSCRGAAVELTATEFNILKALLAYPRKVFTRSELMDHAYSDGTMVSERTIDSHMKRIRRKFERHCVPPIETVHGIGYRIARADHG
ncbi:MAG: response regulator transcription factor [Myxococcota bacterium]|nr:response regulator transcription factor [Myxococcota bacterium]